MARQGAPCNVPRCKGRLELGKREGKQVEWCPVCERRLLQLESLHARLAALEATPSAASLTDAQVISLIGKRVVLLRQASKVVHRNFMKLLDAANAKAFPSVRIGKRFVLVPLASVQEWCAKNPSRAQVSESVGKVVPRTAAQARTIAELCDAADVSPSAVYAWLKRNSHAPELTKHAVMGRKGRPAVAYWWKEATNA